METRVTTLETRLDTILPTLATKSDLSEAKADIIKWVAGAALAIVTMNISTMAFLLNRGPAPANAQPTPIVIYPQMASPAAPRDPVAK